jgi:ferritin-like metal-binding protein YciE
MEQQARDLFITGCKNAHAMERNAQEMLERQIASLGDRQYTDLKARLREHLSETKQQLGRLEKILADLDSGPSMVKDTVEALTANMVALAQSMAGDAVLKNSFASAALESYEIAAYNTLLILADQASIRVKTTLEESLREEERMLEWLNRNVEAVTLEFLKREEKAAA